MGIRKEITTLSVNTSSRQTAQNVKIYCDLLCFDLHDINSGIWIWVVSCESYKVQFMRLISKTPWLFSKGK